MQIRHKHYYSVMAIPIERKWLVHSQANARKWSFMNPGSATILLMLVYAAYFSIYTITRHRAFMTQSFDLSVYVQMLWNSLNGDLFRVTIQPGRLNYLQHHFAPSMFLFIPVYGIWKNPEILLVAQSLVLASGAWPIYKVASKGQLNQWRGVVFVLVYLLYPALQAANLYDFHEVTIAAPLLAWTWYFARNQIWPAFWITTFLALGFREEAVIITLGMGLVMACRQDTRRIGFGLVSLCLLWLSVLFAVSFFQSKFNMNAALYFQERFGLGSNPFDAIKNILADPNEILHRIFSAEKMLYLFNLLAPVGFLLLFSWESLFLVLPYVGLNLIGSYPLLIAPTQAQYNVLVVPMIVITAEIGSARFSRFLSKHSKFSNRVWIPILCFYMLLLSFGYQFRLAHLPYSPYFKWPQITERHQLANRIALEIPENASLSVQDNLAPHASQRRDLYIFPETNQAQYIYLDLWVLEDLREKSVMDLTAQVEAVLSAGSYETVFEQDGLLLLRKTSFENE